MSENDQKKSSEMGPPAHKRRRSAWPVMRAGYGSLDQTTLHLSLTDWLGYRPSCSSCLSLGVNCLYEPGDSTTNVIARKDYVPDLEQRVASVEHNLQKLNALLKGHLSPCTTNNMNHHNNHDSPCRQPVIEQSIISSRPNTRDKSAPNETCTTGLEEPDDEDANTNGMAMTFVEEKTSVYYGEASNINFTQLLLRALATVHGATPVAPSASNQASGPGDGVTADMSLNKRAVSASDLATLESSPTALPAVQEMDNLMDIYFDTAGVVFPFICEDTMRKTYNECRNNGFTSARRTWLGTLSMIFALASCFKSNVFYRRATALCGELSKRVVSLEIVHYLILVVLHCQGTQRSVQAWNNHGLAIRSAMALGLHCQSSGVSLDSAQQEYRRRTWVVIYCLDKVLSTAFGRPASIADEQMHSFNRRESVTGLSPMSLSNPGVPVDLPGDFLSVSFRLYQVMSKSLVDQYGTNLDHGDSGHDDMASLKASGELRKQLRLWAGSLPGHLRVCQPEDEFLAHNSQGNRLRVILTLRYHNLGILIHKPLLSATIRHLFQAEKRVDAPPPYMIQLAMAEAHECLRSAQLTIDIVHAVISADPSPGNNLGAWYFTLYYVFTASLAVSGRLLWARHGQSTVDEVAVDHCKSLLSKAEEIFQKLDHENSLVLSCLEYIARLARICSIKDVPPNPHKGSSNITSDTTNIASGIADTIPFDEDGMDALQLLAAEMFDPNIVKGFNLSPEGVGFTDGIWEGFPCGG
ncbi:transcription factor [Fusarium mundagurra]|uniref:Transcription factor n=1 Tax=Fusarium mundagurra TaxID=1567541 RepID=A0A8H5YAL6_9HYPO|nr:transcription factor [Fusarium mundagurra]